MAQRAPELGHEPRLADAGLAHDADDLPLPLAGLVKEVPQGGEVSRAPDETRERRVISRVGRGAPPRDAGDLEGRHRLGPPSDLDGAERLEPHVPGDQPRRRLADHDRPRLGQLLKAGGDVGRVPDHGVVERAPGAQAPDEGPAGVQPHSDPELRVGPAVPALPQPLLDGERGQHGAPGVVLVG